MTTGTARRAADDLETVRDHWGRLRLAIETPRAAEAWPPRQLAHLIRPAEEGDPLDVLDRAPLVLRPHPAPLNLSALDTVLAVERMLFALADTLAAAVQRAPADHPRRWDLPTERHPGSRVHGVHWAALWIVGRVLDEETEPEQGPDGEQLAPAPFAPLPGYLLREAAGVAARARARVLGALDLDTPAEPIPDRPCPWCGGELTLHHAPDPDEPPAVTCATGEACTAPVPLDDRGRRRWGWPALLDLLTLLDAAEQRHGARAA